MKKKVKTFSLPAGRSCPGANECKSMAVVDKQTGKRTIKDGKNTQFRCFAASQEVQYTNTFLSRKKNFDLLKRKRSVESMANLIDESLNGKGPLSFGKGNAKLDAANIEKETIRIHVSGDFFNQRYFDAWLEVARRNPNKHFYAYTKSIPYWVARKNEVNSLPNFILTASRGGKFDALINLHELREARVVFSEREAEELGLEIDHDDSHAMNAGPSFALLLHGTQPADTVAAKALVELKKQGKGGYSKRKKK